MPPVVIVDTTVLLNVLDVPGLNQDRGAVLDRFGELVDAGANFLLPLGTILETGNHIADVRDGQRRRRHATVFADQVRKALKGEAPWALAPLPDADELVRWLDTFPDKAMRGLGMVDLSIVKEWDRACRRHPHRRISVWSLDRRLTGYDRIP